ncbi:MAG: hypothetical protein PHW53_01990 [Patescibacteria group bacterium]|nr:hypothetical protein [Patescibacteria group bacterium]
MPNDQEKRYRPTEEELRRPLSPLEDMSPAERRFLERAGPVSFHKNPYISMYPFSGKNGVPQDEAALSAEFEGHWKAAEEERREHPDAPSHSDREEEIM